MGCGRTWRRKDERKIRRMDGQISKISFNSLINERTKKDVTSSSKGKTKNHNFNIAKEC